MQQVKRKKTFLFFPQTNFPFSLCLCLCLSLCLCFIQKQKMNSFLRLKSDTLQKISSFLPSLPPSKPKHVRMMEIANSHMQVKNYQEAIEKYKDCLIEMKFGKEGIRFSAEELDGMIIPLLCNLATCLLEIREYHKVLFYCNQILIFRPNHRRGLYLQSVAHVQIGSFQSAMKFYRR